MKTTFIYKLIDPETNQVRYIGKSNDPKQRLKAHYNKARYKPTHKFNWIKTLKDRGIRPIMEIIEEVSIEIWKEREKYWIMFYLEQGFSLTNCTTGGDGLTFGNQTSFKKGHKVWLGKKHSEETKKKISKNNYLRGKPNSRRRKIVQLTLNGDFIKTFDFIHQAAKELNFSASKIVSCCKGRRKTHKNFKWIYYEDFNNR